MSSDDCCVEGKKNNKHHVLPKARLRKEIAHGGKPLLRAAVVSISVKRHDAYHVLFGPSYPWEVISLLKKWSKQLKNGHNEPRFYEGFSPNKLQSFKILFGCEPQELINGNLKTALEVIGNTKEFYPSIKVKTEFIEKKNGLIH